MIRIYRIENRTGWGPYQGYDDLGRKGQEYWHTSQHSEWRGNKHPNPHSLISLWDSENQDYICGFKSIQQLKEWFTPEELHNMSQIGFYLRSYLIPKDLVIMGSKQLVFKKPLDLKEAA